MAKQKSTAGKLSAALGRVIASASAIAAAAGVAFVGLALLLTGVVIIQQALARGFGFGVRLGDAFAWTARAISALGAAAPGGARA